MSVSFDGTTKRILCSSGTTSIDVQDVYSDWKEWVMSSDNAKFLQAFSVVGGEPTVSGQFLGATFFLLNGWKIVPQSANHILDVIGNLYCDDGSNPFVNVTGGYNVLVRQLVTNIINTVATGGSEAPTVSQIADEIMSRDVATNAKTKKSIIKFS